MKQIDAETFKQELLHFPCSEWVYQGICEIIDQMQPANKQPEIIYSATIPLNPRTKKNNQKIIKNNKTNALMVVQGDIYKQYEKEAGWFLRKPPVSISQPVNIRVIFYRDNERRCDLTNLLEAVDDILIKYKIIADDNFKIIRGHDGSRVFIDRNNPRTEIYIETFKE